MSTNFLDINYLKNGNARQIQAYEVLVGTGIWTVLSPYDPILTGTIPIEIDIETSDLDVVCKIADPKVFITFLRENFGQNSGFCIYEKSKDVVVCCFEIRQMQIEIYASSIDPENSNAYRHMLVEYRLLKMMEANFKDEIVKLKEKGLKTEPAFAALLGINGDSFEELLKLGNCSDKELEKMFKGGGT